MSIYFEGPVARPRPESPRAVGPRGWEGHSLSHRPNGELRRSVSSVFVRPPTFTS